MEYQVAFDLHQNGFKAASFPAFGLIFVAIGLALVLLPRMIPFLRETKWGKGVFPWIYLGFALLWTCLTFGSTFGEYRTVKRAYESGTAQVAEGKVAEFVPMPFEGHADESFSVQGHSFHYSDFGVTNGFNNTSSHGGPIRDGLQVRVTFVGNVIVKLEVAR